MDWIKSFQKAVDYVEEHICEPVDYKRIAQEMNVSSFYFQKIFSILCGFTVGEYIRSRRLALAGSELLSTDEKIIDIALKYGYDSPEGFTRAFARFHGITPSDVRKNGAPVRSFARLSVSISVKGGSSMDYKIMKKEAFKIIAKEQRFKKVEDIQGRSDIPAFWTECHGDGTVKYLSENCKKDGVLGGSVVGMCMEDSTVVKDFPYLIGAEYAGGDVPNGYKVVDVPAAEWAVFGIDGLSEEKIQQAWHKIFAEFFPSSTYKPAGNFDLEVYTTDTYKGEIWISVEKKG
ncbi:MAG: AraC family transcriptional regulator [Oscillospiraceae bacterium]|jgi:AraC family transcriptional regulator|nr:AraC family transcriptional regulator [Oscillospiraceae bacterium]